MIDFQPADGTVSLKAGIYSDAGPGTCGSIYDADTIGVGVGLNGHDRQDCDFFFFRDQSFDFKPRPARTAGLRGPAAPATTGLVQDSNSPDARRGR